ncbi:MAG: inositol monophosphatase family protein [Candidatus Thorarchaeota archaeon]|jgi:myo-inositol-1(or 4)-monophosphatase
MTLIRVLLDSVEAAKNNVLQNLDVATEKTGSLNPFGDNTLFLDKSTEDIMIERLQDSGISFTFMTEEQGVISTAEKVEYIAIIDPIDGSTNLERGIPLSSIGISLIPYSNSMTSDDIEISIIDSIFTDETYIAIQGQGVTKNGKRVKPSPPSLAKDSIVSYDTKRPWKGEFGSRSRSTLEGLHDMRRTGSNLLDLCWTAAGSLDAMVDLRNLLPIVHVSGTHMVSEAGGYVVDSTGNRFCIPIEYDQRMSFVAASTKTLALEILSLHNQSNH